jgi:hypothetical protein
MARRTRILQTQLPATDVVVFSELDFTQHACETYADGRDIIEQCGAIQTASEGFSSLDRLSVKLKQTADKQTKVSKVTMQMSAIAVESIYGKLGITKTSPLVSLESYTDTTYANEHFGLAVEGIGDTIAAGFKAVWKFILEMIEKFKGWMDKAGKFFSDLKDKFDRKKSMKAKFDQHIKEGVDIAKSMHAAKTTNNKSAPISDELSRLVGTATNTDTLNFLIMSNILIKGTDFLQKGLHTVEIVMKEQTNLMEAMTTGSEYTCENYYVAVKEAIDFNIEDFRLTALPGGTITEVENQGEEKRISFKAYSDHVRRFKYIEVSEYPVSTLYKIDEILEKLGSLDALGRNMKDNADKIKAACDEAMEKLEDHWDDNDYVMPPEVERIMKVFRTEKYETVRGTIKNLSSYMQYYSRLITSSTTFITKLITIMMRVSENTVRVMELYDQEIQASPEASTN